VSGTSPPAAAEDHAAARNSSVVATRSALGDLFEHVAGTRETIRSLPGTLAHLIVQEDLAARRRINHIDGLERTLVRYRERTNLIDLVAKELDAERMRFGWREHVKDAAADRELSTRLHHVDAHVGSIDEALCELLQRHFVAGPHTHGNHVPQALDDGLKQGTDRDNKNR